MPCYEEEQSQTEPGEAENCPRLGKRWAMEVGKGQVKDESKILSSSNWRMWGAFIGAGAWILGKRKWVLFGHITLEVSKDVLVAWKEDRTSDRDLGIMCVKGTARATGTGAMEKGERAYRGLAVVSSQWGEECFPGYKEKPGGMAYLGDRRLGCSYVLL